MRAGFWIAGAASLLVLAGGMAGALAKPDSPAVLSAEETVAARQSAFMLSGAAMGAMKGAIDAKADPKTMAFTARALDRWAKQLPDMFPEGTALESSSAKPEVWSDRAGFDAKAADYAAATSALVAAAQAGDQAAFAERWADVRQACGACHDAYRAEKR